jgi:hypothetical protein
MNVNHTINKQTNKQTNKNASQLPKLAGVRIVAERLAGPTVALPSTCKKQLPLPEERPKLGSK